MAIGNKAQWWRISVRRRIISPPAGAQEDDILKSLQTPVAAQLFMTRQPTGALQTTILPAAHVFRALSSYYSGRESCFGQLRRSFREMLCVPAKGGGNCSATHTHLHNASVPRPSPRRMPWDMADISGELSLVAPNFPKSHCILVSTRKYGWIYYGHSSPLASLIAGVSSLTGGLSDLFPE